MEKATVLVIGGEPTGVGILRDLTMRGIDVMLLEVEACKKINLPTIQIDPAEAWHMEPNLTHRAQAVYRVPNAAIDGFCTAWQNIDSAERNVLNNINSARTVEEFMASIKNKLI